MIVWSGRHCSGTESVTALICSDRNRTEQDKGYSHLLACSAAAYGGRNAAHIHLPFDDITYNIDQTLELTVMLIVCSIVVLYAKYLAKVLRMVRCRNKKCSETGLKQCCSGHCSGTESVTALICSDWNRTEPDKGYLHLLACFSATYRGRNAAQIHLPFDDITYNIDQTLELTVMLIVCSIVVLYAKYLANVLRMVRCRNKKCSETGPKRCCSDENSTGTVPVPVLSLLRGKWSVC